MAEQSNRPDRIRPAAGRHAIETMALAVEWEQPIDGAGLASAANIFRNNASLFKLLPIEKKFPGFAVRIENLTASVVADNAEIVDFTQQSSEGLMTWGLSLRPEFFSCSCVAYTRWAEVKPFALQLLEPLAAFALEQGSKIRAVGLQYSDAFRWALSDTSAIREVLRDGMP